jgi:hypothetical protein
MDLTEALAQKRERDLQSRKLLENAKKPPSPTTKGGAFQSNAPGSGSDKAADPPGQYDGGLSGGVIHTADQEDNIKQKASHGITITDADLHGYLGHLGKDEVLRKGHNPINAKSLNPEVKDEIANKLSYLPSDQHPDQHKGFDVPLAQKGYKKLPGTGVNQVGHARYGHAPTGLKPTRHEQRIMDENNKASEVLLGRTLMTPMSMNDKPKALSDVKMSIRHHEDSIAYNKRHMVEHKNAMVKHEKELKERKKQLITSKEKKTKNPGYY